MQTFGPYDMINTKSIEVFSVVLSELELKTIGICQYGIISPKEICFDDGIRDICQANTCRQYGKTWACPPAVGTVAQCKERCLSYQHAMVFNAVYPLVDSFDYEGMTTGHRNFKKLCDRLYLLAKEKFPGFLLLSNEGCNRCRQCTYPESRCRVPEMLFPSIEGFGIQVAALSAAAGIQYNNGAHTVTYFGMLLY